MTKRLFLSVLVSIPLFVVTSFAQDTGRIAGRVAREDGTGVGGVTVVINEISMADITDQGGSFVFDNVPVGTYSITFILGESSDSESGIEVTAGMSATIEKAVDWEIGFVETMTVTSASLQRELYRIVPIFLDTVAALSYNSVHEAQRPRKVLPQGNLICRAHAHVPRRRNRRTVVHSNALAGWTVVPILWIGQFSVSDQAQIHDAPMP